jgi:hypothetical protein
MLLITTSLARSQSRGRASESPDTPGDALEIAPLPELIELHLDGGIQQPQLNQKFSGDCRRFRKPKGLRKQVREVQIQGSEGVDKLLDRRRIRIGQINLVIQLFAENAPIEFNEGMLFADFAYDLVCDASAVTEAGEVQLANFSTPAHVMHQVVGVSFAANKSHCTSSAKR